MATISSTVTIAASNNAVFDLLTNPKAVMSFIPGGMRVTNVPRLPLTRGSIVTWEFMLLGIPLRGKWVVEEINRPFFYIAKTSGGVDGRLVYTLLPKGKYTQVTLDFEYRPPQSVVRRFTLGLVEPHAQNTIDTYLAGLKTFLELPAAKRKTSGR